MQGCSNLNVERYGVVEYLLHSCVLGEGNVAEVGIIIFTGWCQIVTLYLREQDHNMLITFCSREAGHSKGKLVGSIENKVLIWLNVYTQTVTDNIQLLSVPTHPLS